MSPNLYLYLALAGSATPLGDTHLADPDVFAGRCALGPQPESIPVRENRGRSCAFAEVGISDTAALLRKRRGLDRSAAVSSTRHGRGGVGDVQRSL